VKEEMIVVGFWEVHRIDVCAAEEGSWSRDRWGNKEFPGLADLTLMAGAGVPADILI
jgi:hypothetical protein